MRDLLGFVTLMVLLGVAMLIPLAAASLLDRHTWYNDPQWPMRLQRSIIDRAKSELIAEGKCKE